MNTTQCNVTYRLSDIAKKFKLSYNGDGDCLIHGVSQLKDARPGYISFLASDRHKKYLQDTDASAVILQASDAADSTVNTLISENPEFTYANVASLFEWKTTQPKGACASVAIGEKVKISDTASIGANCVIGNHVEISDNVVISPGCVIEDFVKIERGTYLFPNVTIGHHVVLGENVIISSGTVIGSDGFGLVKHKNEWHKIPQVGTVIIENNVEIGANCTIDRGAIENTVLEKGVKIDNQVQVAHNVRIGSHTVIAGCVGIAGSTTIGKNCMIGGGSGIGGHLTICDQVLLTGMSMVTKSIDTPGMYSSGTGLFSNISWRRMVARLHQLDAFVKKVKNFLKLSNFLKKESTNS